MEKSNSIKELIKNIKEMTYQWQFSTIIQLINAEVPEFFAANDNILYIIMKFILIDKLRSGAQSDAQAFYEDYLRQILKKTHPNNFEEKNALFLSLVNNPNLCADNSNISLRYSVDLKQQAYFERFNSFIERLFLNNKTTAQGNNPQVDYFSDYEKDYYSINCNPSVSTNNTMSLNNSINLGSSTMPLFNVTVDNAMNVKTITRPNRRRSNFKLFVVNKRYTKIKPDTYHNHNHNNKTYSKDAENVQNNSKSLLPSACLEHYFHPKYPRRVNISKKICRKFKKYLKERSDLLFNSFWLQFVKNKLLPPFRLEEEKIEFKSFSHNYLKWLFDHEGSNELYQSFINDRADVELKAIYDEYQIEDIDDRKTLGKYFKEFCFLFNKKKTFNYDYVQSHLANLQMIDIEEEEIKKDELFDGLIEELCKDEKNKRKKRTQFERSREADFNVFDNLIESGSSCSFSSDKEE